MADEPVLHGSRMGTLQWVDRLSISGRPALRITYRFTGDHHGSSHQTVLSPTQVYRNPHTGDLVRIHFSLQRVLRIEKAS